MAESAGYTAGGSQWHDGAPLRARDGDGDSGGLIEQSFPSSSSSKQHQHTPSTSAVHCVHRGDCDRREEARGGRDEQHEHGEEGRWRDGA